MSVFNPAALSQVGVAGRTVCTSEAERERAFVDLSSYRDGVITLGKFSGSSQWERHPKGDELVQVIAGEIVLRVEYASHRMRAGDMIVIPADRWHQIYAPDMASVLYVTPRPTIHFDGDPMGRQLDPLSGRGARLLDGLVRAWWRLRRE